MLLKSALSACSMALFCSGLACDAMSLPDMSPVPATAAGYQLEQIADPFVASFARDDDVFLLGKTGEILKVSDSDLTKPAVSLGSPFRGWGRSLYVSKAGAIFASGDDRPLYRSTDDGATYAACLDSPIWRMDEDDLGNLYAGNYIKDAQHVATLYKSVDGGANWSVVFTEPRNHHIHTVRWDDRVKRVYIAYGDGPNRGQAYSDDRGATWHVLASGPTQGHTDVAFTRDNVVWASDDQSGRIFAVDKASGRTRTADIGTQFLWFAVARDQQVFVGTAVSRAGQHACLLASSDEGQTWQKVLQSSEIASRPYADGMIAESRSLSAGGWLYFTRAGQTIQSYRIRKIPPVDP